MIVLILVASAAIFYAGVRYSEQVVRIIAGIRKVAKAALAEAVAILKDIAAFESRVIVRAKKY